MAVVIYTKRFCGFCVRAKRLLDDLGVEYREVPVDTDPQAHAAMREKSGRHTVPQIWIGDRHVGGCDELFALQRSGGLVEMLQRSQD